jgi:type I restriction enzyme S subunit
MTPIVALGEVAAINPDTSIHIGANDLCSFVPMDAVDETTAEIKKLSARPYNEVSRGYTSFAENDVLLAKITPCMENGKCAIARGLRNGVGFGSTEFHVIRGSAKVLPEWVYYYWRLPATRALAQRNMTGTAGQKRVPTSFLETLPIPVPQVDDQRNLTRLLQHADQLCRMRRHALKMCDELLPETFLDIFGDPASNPHSYPTVFGEELFDAERDGAKCGPFGSALKNSEYIAVGIPVWTMANVQENHFTEDNCLYISEKKFEKLKAYSIIDGDILISRAGTVGRMAIVRTRYDRSIMHSNLIRLALNHSLVAPEYFVTLMTWFGSRVAKLKTGQEDAYSFMNTGALAELPIPLPPANTQKIFVSFVRQHEQLHAIHVEALRQADHLFHTLLHEAFSNGQ